MVDIVPKKDMNGPLTLVREGKRQLIRISLKTMLTKVMNILGARSRPLFTEIDCGAEGFKVSITIDLSCGQTGGLTVIEGSPMKEKYSAEISAAMLAFKHLDQRCQIKILDFSSRIEMSYGEYNTNFYVSEAMDLVNKVLNKFDMTLSKYKDFALELNIKEVADRFSEDNDGNVIMYDDLSDFLLQVVKSFSIEASALRSRLTALDFDLIKHHKIVKDIAKTKGSKEYLKQVTLPAKHLLDYVLCYFGLEFATYASGPHGKGEVKAVVQFTVPYIQHLKYCGTLKVKGVADTSINAEENAAYNALLLVEQNFKAKIVDLNHADRVEAENMQKKMAKLLEAVLNVGEAVKDMCENLISELNKRCIEITNEAHLASKTLMLEKHIRAYKHCSDGIKGVVKKSKDSFDECCGPIERLNEILDDLNLIMISLDMM